MSEGYLDRLVHAQPPPAMGHAVIDEGADMTTTPIEVHGMVADGYEVVADAFRQNFSHRGDVGAAFSAVREGQTVVDLWAGYADSSSRAPWRQDTAVVLFSGTKGLVALCLLMLIDRGQIDLDRPVCTYWPEFAANGKGHVTVRDVVSHQARLPAIRQTLSEHDVVKPRRMARLLAEQSQEAAPRVAFAYHALTYGWMVGELIYRVDGRRVGRFFADEVARPLELDLWIGIDPALEPRVARLEYASDWAAMDPARTSAAEELRVATFENPPLFPMSHIPWNTPAWHQAEIPGGNGIGTARSMARLYGALAQGGEIDGVRLLGARTLTEGRRELSRGIDVSLGEQMVFATGFQLQSDAKRYGPPANAYGHAGAGGSVHGAWPTARIGYSYAMNQLRSGVEPDERPVALLRQLHQATRAM